MTENEKRIVLIGAGQLGSRHLQGLAQVEVPSYIDVVDPSPTSLDLARQRFQEMAPGMVREVCYVPSLEAIPEQVDLAIVATGADVRASIVEALLGRCKVSHLIMEKVLFQKEVDYAKVGKLFNSCGVTAVVNCPRRLYPFYQNLRELLASDGPLSLAVEGSLWGLGCNAVHFLDLFAYLTREGVCHIEEADLGDRVLESKRLGYVEFTGTISGGNSRQDRFTITSSAEPGKEAHICIKNAKRHIEIYETGGKVLETDRASGAVVEKPFSVIYQSQLTGRVATEILTRGTCGLTPYLDSAALHLPMLQAFLGHLERATGVRRDHCPIT